jgi:hypothetical protein
LDINWCLGNIGIIGEEQVAFYEFPNDIEHHWRDPKHPLKMSVILLLLGIPPGKMQVPRFGYRWAIP